MSSMDMISAPVIVEPSVFAHGKRHARSRFENSALCVVCLSVRSGVVALAVYVGVV